MIQATRTGSGTPERTTLGEGHPSRPNFVAIRQSAEFIQLRRRLLLFVFPVSALFFAWYLTYVLLAAYAHDFMSRPLFGEINVALALGVLQFLTTVAITISYARYAAKQIDPRVDKIRKKAGVRTQ